MTDRILVASRRQPNLSASFALRQTSVGIGLGRTRSITETADFSSGSSSKLDSIKLHAIHPWSIAVTDATSQLQFCSLYDGLHSGTDMSVTANPIVQLAWRTQAHSDGNLRFNPVWVKKLLRQGTSYTLLYFCFYVLWRVRVYVFAFYTARCVLTFFSRERTENENAFGDKAASEAFPLQHLSSVAIIHRTTILRTTERVYSTDELSSSPHTHDPWATNNR